MYQIVCCYRRTGDKLKKSSVTTTITHTVVLRSHTHLNDPPLSKKVRPVAAERPPHRKETLGMCCSYFERSGCGPSIFITAVPVRFPVMRFNDIQNIRNVNAREPFVRQFCWATGTWNGAIPAMKVKRSFRGEVVHLGNGIELLFPPVMLIFCRYWLTSKALSTEKPRCTFPRVNKIPIQTFTSIYCNGIAIGSDRRFIRSGSGTDWTVFFSQHPFFPSLFSFLLTSFISSFRSLFGFFSISS